MSLVLVSVFAYAIIHILPADAATGICAGGVVAHLATQAEADAIAGMFDNI